MKKLLFLTCSLALASASASAQDFTPTRSVTAFTEIEDEYYGDPFTVTDVDNLDNLTQGDFEGDVEAEVTFAGSVTYADAGQTSWIDFTGGDFECDGYAAGGLYNQYNGEMRSESLFQADFNVASTGAMIFSYDLWFGNSFGGLTSHDRAGASIAEVRIEDSLGNTIFSDSSSFEGGDLSGFANVPLGPGQYRFLARAEISDATSFQTVVGSMTVANFYIEGAVIGGTPVIPPSASSMHVASIGTSSDGARRGRSGMTTVVVLDNTGSPVAGALVTGTFSGGSTTGFAATTDASGLARFRAPSDKRGRKQKVTCCVNDVVHGTLVYDSAQNATSCD